VFDNSLSAVVARGAGYNYLELQWMQPFSAPGPLGALSFGPHLQARLSFNNVGVVGLDLTSRRGS